MKLLVLLGIFAHLIYSSVAQLPPFPPNEELVVEAGDLGRVHGLYHWTTNERNRYVTFAGIPYAKSTNESNRFKPSELREGRLAETEDGTFFAVNGFIYCPQDPLIEFPSELMNMSDAEGARNPQRVMELYEESIKMNQKRMAGPKNTIGEEDCLVLNINTPKIPRTPEEIENGLPVIVFIHGGASHSIWGSLWNGARFMDFPCVLVTINYRLGILGSFNLGIDDAPGNAALYDAVTSLQWIQKYIKYFGGDPNRVTITGQSAGSMMVSHLLISPLGAGLFHGVIGSSGSALACWGTSREPSMPDHLDVARRAGCDQTEANDILECMRQIPAEQLVQALNDHIWDQESNAKGLGFDVKVPSIQNSPLLSEGFVKFLPEHPLKVLREGRQNKVPIIMGATRHDGSYILDGLYYNYIKHNDLINNGSFLKHDLIPTFMNFVGMQDIDGRSGGSFLHALGRTFIGDAYSTETLDDKMPGALDLVSVFGMKGPDYQLVEFHSEFSPSYYYDFEFKGLFSLYYLVLVGQDSVVPGGVAHTDDMINPNGDDSAPQFWPQFNRDDQDYLIVDREDRVSQYAKDAWVNVAKELYPEDPPTTTSTTTTSPNPEVTTQPPPTTSGTSGPTRPQPTTPPTTPPVTASSSNLCVHLSILLICLSALF